MVEEGFQDKLLRKLSAVEGERLEAEAVRAKIKPRVKSTAWRDFRRVASWHFRRDLVVGGWILALLLTGILAAKISVVMLMLWFLALCLVVMYGIGRLMYRIFFAIYFFLTWKKPT